MLSDADLLLCEGRVSGRSAALDKAEIEAQEQLRRQSLALGIDLPLDQLAHIAHLCPFEEEVVLLCAMPELDRSYEQRFAKITARPSRDLLLYLRRSGMELLACRRK